VLYDAAGPDDAPVVAVLLHPHPHFGGDRHHPFVGNLYRRLPDVGLGAVRFDLASADGDAAAEQVLWAVDVAANRWPAASVVLVGYSFGAGIACRVDDERVRGWFLVAPPAQMLPAATIGGSPCPKRIVVPARDQFSTLDSVGDATVDWKTTDIDAVDDDHFLWNVMDAVVGAAVEWVAGVPTA
jgi:uncharacterized protein